VAKFLNDGTSTPAAANMGAEYQPRQVTMPRDAPKQPDALATLLMQPWKRGPGHKRRWSGDLAAVATLLVLACWIAYVDREPILLSGPLELQSMATINEQVPLPDAKNVRAQSRARVRTMPIVVGHARATSVLYRVVLPTEVVHSGEDVTVRYFTPKPEQHRESIEQYQVLNMGEDVTVRYFTPVVRNSKN
jgi:hypothetical protein